MGMCQPGSVRISQLLNQLCSESQNENILTRDACYGCFFRATNKPSGYPMLLSMSSCAELYLGDSDYGHCQEYLKNAVANSELNSSPAVIYCTFLECVRQVNKDSLEALMSLRYEKSRASRSGVPSKIKSATRISVGFHFVRRAIQTCIRESLDMFDNFTASDMKLAQLVVNTTACILAKTRCGSMNPITGAYKASNTSTKYSIIPTINAILVNTDYNINIIQMPFGHGVIDECAKYRNIEQASWPNLQC
ncbi:Protein of unknown function [Cotesia congregata]|uniref:Uncharacterized protein n=1 Tax=Cotesia congregata TaxID=51543 RepID=A0A8J2MPC1_COTCN|nr:Protein of unknown function [Cotesia congregata]